MTLAAPMQADLLTTERIKEIAARAEKATPGEWSFNTYNTIWSGPDKIVCEIPDHPNGEQFTPEQIAERSAWYKESEHNATFIAASRTDIPALCTSHLAALEKVAELERMLGEADAVVDLLTLDHESEDERLSYHTIEMRDQAIARHRSRSSISENEKS